MRKCEFLFKVIFLVIGASVFAAVPYYSPDLDGSEFVDFNDFARFAANWQQTGSGLEGDFDDSGLVDINDLRHFVFDWANDLTYPPVAYDQNVIITQGCSIEITLQADDENGDPLDYFMIAYPENGPLTVDGNTATYTPFASYDGNDVFEFLAHDGKYESNIATIHIVVKPDSDGDGLSDEDEINIHGTNPNDPNSDTDNMPDGWEVKGGLNPIINDGAADKDGDSLSNENEYIAGTDPNAQDTDEDGLSDGDEVNGTLGSYGPVSPYDNDYPDYYYTPYAENPYDIPTNPLKADTDGDGVSDRKEIEWGINPNDPDTDGDGVDDGVEVSYRYGGVEQFRPYPLWAHYDDGDWDNPEDWEGWEDCDLNANSTDTDGDGMLDSWEIKYEPEYGGDWLDPRYNGIIIGQLDADNDCDFDGLTNVQEHDGYYPGYGDFGGSTNPSVRDSDGDEEHDGYECGATLGGPYCFDTSPYKFDTDDDGLSDTWENQQSFCKYNPTLKDTDNDGWEDGYEVQYELEYYGTYSSPWYLADMTADYDNDGLINEDEHFHGTDPVNDTDSDNDGLTDGDEANTHGTDPTDPDSDDDGLLDGDEITANTDPLDFDTDDDLLPDGWEVDNGLDPNSDTGDDGRNGNPDGDGATNFEELIYGTDPDDPASNPAALIDSGKEYLDVKLTVGDHSGSHSERYNLKVGSITHQAPEFGVVEERVYPFEVGKKYDIEIVWVDSNQTPPDYDYTALVEPNDSILPEGVGFILDDPDSILGIHTESTEFYAEGKTAYLTLVKADLKLYNGGNNGSNGAEVPDVNETNLGGYLLVNWDDDNGNDKPDLYESTASSDDDLAKIELSLLPAGLEGTVELTGFGCNIKIWDNQNKQNEITDPNWAVADMPSELWIEAITPSNTERDIGLSLVYTKNNTTIATDTVKATAVMINLGNVVGREVNNDIFAERGHTSIVGKFTGTCTKGDLVDASKYTLFESDGGDDWWTEPGPREASLTHVTARPGREFFGDLTPFLTSYAASGLTYTNRLAILKTAKWLIEYTNNIEYSKYDAVWSEDGWDTSLPDIDKIRCDGFVEVCYELNGYNSWGLIDGGNARFPIGVFQDEHNEWRFGDDPEDGEDDFWAWLMPITQIGYADTYILEHYPSYSGGDFDYTTNNFRGTFWDSAFVEQGLISPILE
ncbi:MAG: hypothetical protein B6I25_07565 [Planctomycetales bacterium 4572_13]|nr:MAG: hypothetical protein B6I25_07565 [Planctomycetales bacterium 4572_13]